MTIKNAAEAKALTEKAMGVVNVDPLFNFIMAEVEKAASQGKNSIIYPFDQYPDEVPSRVRTAVRKRFEAAEFTWEHRDTQDPGHPCDRPIDTISW